ncbi:MAG: hypothetical protein WA840_03680 [Caulobacteraceae bacterium]
MDDNVARVLPGMEQKALSLLGSRAPCPVATYRTILTSTAADDLNTAEAEPTRRRFNAYYGVRRNAAWRALFYAQFQAAKRSSLGPSELFKAVVESLSAQTGRIEASFASKLVATLRPNGPVIDSIVRSWLARHLEPPRFASDLDTVVTYYRWLEVMMLQTAKSPQAQHWSAVFDQAFPTPTGEMPISDIKRLDFLIWAGADR